MEELVNTELGNKGSLQAGSFVPLSVSISPEHGIVCTKPCLDKEIVSTHRYIVLHAESITVTKALHLKNVESHCFIQLKR